MPQFSVSLWWGLVMGKTGNKARRNRQRELEEAEAALESEGTPVIKFAPETQEKAREIIFWGHRGLHYSHAELFEALCGPMEMDRIGDTQLIISAWLSGFDEHMLGGVVSYAHKYRMVDHANEHKDDPCIRPFLAWCKQEVKREHFNNALWERAVYKWLDKEGVDTNVRPAKLGLKARLTEGDLAERKAMVRYLAWRRLKASEPE